MATKTITIDNTGNVQALQNDQVEVNLSSTDIDFSTIQDDGSDVHFADGTTLLNHYVDYVDKTDNKARIYVKVSVPALSSKQITMYYGNCPQYGSYENTMKRKINLDKTVSLFADGITDKNGWYSDFTLNNCGLADSNVGKILSLNGSNGYATHTDLLKSFSQNGVFGFNFILKTTHAAGSGVKTIWHKYWDANNYIELGLNNSGQFFINYRINSITSNYTGTTTRQYKDKINSFEIRWTTAILNVKLNNDIVITERKTANPSTSSYAMTFAAKNTGTISQYSDIYVYDISYDNFLTVNKSEVNNSKNISQANRTEYDKWEYVASFPSFPAVGIEYGEPSIVNFPTNIKMFYKKNIVATGISTLIYRESADGVTWGNEIEILGNGIGGEANQVHRPYVFENNGTYILLYRDTTTGIIGISPYVKYATSSDGVTWGSFGYTQLTGGANFSAIYDTDNKYKGYVETGDGTKYRIRYFEGTQLSNITNGSPQAIESVSLNGLGYTNSGPFLMKIGSIYHLYTHQNLSTQTLLNNFISRATSDNIDNSADNFTPVYRNEVFTFEKKYSVDQVADIHICQFNGKSYAVVSGYNNSPFQTCIMLYKYDGTLAQLVTDVKVTVS